MRICLRNVCNGTAFSRNRYGYGSPGCFRDCCISGMRICLRNICNGTVFHICTRTDLGIYLNRYIFRIRGCYGDVAVCSGYRYHNICCSYNHRITIKITVMGVKLIAFCYSLLLGCGILLSGLFQSFGHMKKYLCPCFQGSRQFCKRSSCSLQHIILSKRTVYLFDLLQSIIQAFDRFFIFSFLLIQIVYRSFHRRHKEPLISN